MAVNNVMIDCAAPLTEEALTKLPSEIIAVGRYLGAKSRGFSKGTTPEEVVLLHAHGKRIVPIWEADPVDVAAFTREQALADAQGAIEDAKWLGIPAHTAIFFTVDFDASPADIPAIQGYLDAVEKCLNAEGFLLGVYGGIRVIDGVSAMYYWQTCAWSAGATSTKADLYQHPSSLIEGLPVDLDEVIKIPAWWMPPDATVEVKTQTGPLPPDVPSDAWYASGAQFVIDHHLMGTFADGDFKADEPLTRGQAAVMAENLYKLIRG